ncbi:MAG: hypothetical protein HY291_20110 [Planctomycetes bacterium]|nr:hypothetical protein [Planctomycetota bacterium]
MLSLFGSHPAYTHFRIVAPFANGSDMVMRQAQSANLEDTHLVCRLCGAELKYIAPAHLKLHGYTVEQYKKRFDTAFVISPYLRVEMSRRKRKKKNPRQVFRPRLTQAQILKGLREQAQAFESTGQTLSSTWLLTKDAALVHQAVRVFGAWSKALRASGLRRSARFRVAQAALGEKLKRFAKSHTPLTFTALAQGDPALGLLVRRRFGSLARACMVLGIPLKKLHHRWSEAEVRQKIRTRQKAGRSLSATQIKQEEPALVSTAIRRFGAWSKALEACGLRPREIQAARVEKRLAELASQLRAWARKHGALNPSDPMAKDASLFNRTVSRHGSVRAAARALGLPFRAKVEAWSVELVLERLRERQQKGQTLSTQVIGRESPSLYYAAVKYCGSWSRALSMLGLKSQRSRSDTVDAQARRERLLHEVKSWIGRHGKLHSERMLRTAPGLLRRLCHVMGGIHPAAKAWRLPVVHPRVGWSRDVVRQEIATRHAAGKKMNAAAVQEEHGGLYGAARKFFKSWAQALLEAGVQTGPAHTSAFRPRRT